MADNPLTTGYQKLVENIQRMIAKGDRPEEEEMDTGAPPAPPEAPAAAPVPAPGPELGEAQHLEALAPVMQEVEQTVDQLADVPRSSEFPEGKNYPEAIRAYQDMEPEKAEIYAENFRDYAAMLSERQQRRATDARAAIEEEK